jgi:hypothetical protein
MEIIYKISFLKMIINKLKIIKLRILKNKEIIK